MYYIGWSGRGLGVVVDRGLVVDRRGGGDGGFGGDFRVRLSQKVVIFFSSLYQRKWPRHKYSYNPAIKHI